MPGASREVVRVDGKPCARNRSILQAVFLLRCDLNGHNLLGKLYEDPDRWSFQFQSYVQLTRLQILREPATRKVKVVERSLQNNR